MKSQTMMTDKHNRKSPFVTIGRTALTGALLLGLAACSSAPARDADIFYDIRPSLADISYGSTKSVKLQSVSIKGIQSGRPLVIETNDAPLSFQDVRGHLWHEAPASLIETAIADALIASSQDLIIGTADTIDREDYRLKIIVSKFHFTKTNRAYFAFDAVIKDGRGNILSSERYEFEEAYEGTDYGAAVTALEAAITKGISAISDDIAAAL